jgi:hypothetical protein
VSETYYTASAAARQLGISRQRVIELAQARNVGKRPVRGVWLFSEDDLVALRDPALGRPPGRPRKTG